METFLTSSDVFTFVSGISRYQDLTQTYKSGGYSILLNTRGTKYLYLSKSFYYNYHYYCYYYYHHIRLGAQSFEHANVLSEKINFLALGGPEVAIFGPDDLHPMY